MVRYSISPRFMQSTMIGEMDGEKTARAQSIAALIGSAGFPVAISPNMDA